MYTIKTAYAEYEPYRWWKNFCKSLYQPGRPHRQSEWIAVLETTMIQYHCVIQPVDTGNKGHGWLLNFDEKADATMFILRWS